MTHVPLNQSLVMGYSHGHTVANGVGMQGRGPLFHLSSNPAEMTDRFACPEHAAIRSQLLADLLAWSLRAQDPLPYPKDKYIIKTDPRNYLATYR